MLAQGALPPFGEPIAGVRSGIVIARRQNTTARTLMVKFYSLFGVLPASRRYRWSTLLPQSDTPMLLSIDALATMI